MPELWRRFLSTDYMPHGHCYLWEPPLVWLEVITNVAIGLAYLSISFTLLHLVRQVRDLPFQWVYLAFGVFIITCAFTHFMDVWVIWRPSYWIDVSIRLVCAVASLGTAVLILPLAPRAMALADTARLAHARGLRVEELNRDLAALYEKTRETLAEAIPHLVWTAAPDGSVDYVNQRLVDYMGERSLGWGWQDHIDPADRGPVLARWKECLSSGEPFEMECRIRGADGAHRWFLVRALPVRAEGRVVKWFGTCTDVDDGKRLAEERERLLEHAREEVKGRDVFLAIAAHELRTPLTPLRFEIEGVARAAAAGRLGPERLAARLAIADRQLGRLERLVVNLLDVSRLTTGQFELHREEVDLAELVREIAERHSADLAAAGCELALHVEPAVGSWDRLRLDEAVTNLVMNAITYGRGRPITLTLAATEAGLRLDVRDEGEGIAPADQARIFERFERATPERHAGGLGLGLWLVRAIAEAHGGSVRVQSQPSRGSCFTLDLPRA